MNNNLKKKEIFKEILSGIWPAIKGTLIFGVSPYILPTALRKGSKPLSDLAEDLDTKKFMSNIGSNSAGGYAGLFLDFVQLEAYLTSMLILPPEKLHLMFIPVATNALSGTYEIGRSIYQSAKQRVIERNKNKDISNIIKIQGAQ